MTLESFWYLINKRPSWEIHWYCSFSWSIIIHCLTHSTTLSLALSSLRLCFCVFFLVVSCLSKLFFKSLCPFDVLSIPLSRPPWKHLHLPNAQHALICCDLSCICLAHTSWTAGQSDIIVSFTQRKKIIWVKRQMFQEKELERHINKKKTLDVSLPLTPLLP